MKTPEAEIKAAITGKTKNYKSLCIILVGSGTYGTRCPYSYTIFLLSVAGQKREVKPIK